MGTRDFVGKDTVNTYIVNMPLSIISTVTIDEDGEYTIYINGNVSRKKQIEGYKHELRHIFNDDLYVKDDVQALEYNTHKGD